MRFLSLLFTLALFALFFVAPVTTATATPGDVPPTCTIGPHIPGCIERPIFAHPSSGSGKPHPHSAP